MHGCESSVLDARTLRSPGLTTYSFDLRFLAQRALKALDAFVKQDG